MKLIADRPQDEADLHALLGQPQLDDRSAREIVHRPVRVPLTGTVSAR